MRALIKIIIIFFISFENQAQILISEDFESGGLNPLITYETVGSFSSQPGIKNNTNFGSTNVFSFGKSTCSASCFNNFKTTLIITFLNPTFVESINWSEMEIDNNWGSQGQLLLDDVVFSGVTLGAQPVNSGVPDNSARNQNHIINQTVTSIKFVVNDITNLSEIIIDNLQITGTPTQNLVVAYEYWFDNDYSNKITNTTPNLQQVDITTNIETNALNLGLHTINFRFKDNLGEWSTILSSYFYKTPPNLNITSPKIVEFEYWFDDDYANKIVSPASNAASFSINTNEDISTLSDGLHAINTRFKDEENNWSSIQSDFFYKIPLNLNIISPKIVEFEYWFDDDYANKIVSPGSNVASFSINTNEDVSTLPDGLHAINARFKDEENNWSIVQSNFFYKTPNNTIILKDITAYEYWFNDDYANVTNLTIGPNQLENLNTFVVPENTGLGIGNHHINIRFQDSNGKWSSILSEPFDIITLDTPNIETLKNLVIYPNPSNGELNIDFGKNYNHINISAYDTNGKKVYETSNQNSLNLKIQLNLPAGFYLITITADNKNTTRKLIIK